MAQSRRGKDLDKALAISEALVATRWRVFRDILAQVRLAGQFPRNILIHMGTFLIKTRASCLGIPRRQRSL